jgi:hypothetical protein
MLTAKGIYSNLAINHSSSEFVIDFVSIMPRALCQGNQE